MKFLKAILFFSIFFTTNIFAYLEIGTFKDKDEELITCELITPEDYSPNVFAQERAIYIASFKKAYSDLEIETSITGWCFRGYSRILQNNGKRGDLEYHFVRAKMGDRVVAFLSFCEKKLKRKIYIEQLAVAPDKLGKGIVRGMGQKVLEHFEQQEQQEQQEQELVKRIDRLEFFTNKKNTIMLGLCTCLGFETFPGTFSEDYEDYQECAGNYQWYGVTMQSFAECFFPASS
jgi:hypothetical protein